MLILLGSSRGLGHHPFTVETRIRIPYRVHYFNLIFILNMYDDLRARRIIIVNTLCNKAIKGEPIEKDVNDLRDFDFFVERFFNLEYCDIENKYCEKR